MKITFYLLLFSIVLLSCAKEEPRNPQFVHFEIPDVSIRAIETIDENSMWFAGSNGKVGYTNDAGNTWVIDSIKYDTLKPEFRSIAVTDSAVFILSVASPALLYKTTDNAKSWTLVYKDEDPGAFYNAMTISENGLGVAVGDPIDECLSVLITENGGDNWMKISCENLPIVINGEAGFAASNSNVNIIGDNIWLVSGGSSARVFHSDNRGESWRVYNTPVVQGGQMTGIFSSHFYDSQTGIIIGGDWNEKQNNLNNKAITTDGGKTWSLIADGKEPSYRSSVRYVPGTGGQELVAVGIPGISYSKNSGQSWTTLSDESFYTIRFSKDGNTAWLAGSERIAKMEW